MLDFANFLALVSDGNRSSMVVLGLIAFAGGVLLMIRHKRDFDDVFVSERDATVRRFEKRKFRRRTTASTMIAAMGVMLLSLNWARDPYVFATLITMVLALLLGAMTLACFDILSVGLHSISLDDHEARKKMVAEYVRQREMLQQQAADSDEQ